MREARGAPARGEAPAKALAAPYRTIGWVEQRRVMREAERLRAEAVGDALRGLWRGILRLGEAVRRSEQRRGSLHEVLALDDHTLADIGLHRAELQAVARGLVRWEQVFVPRAADAGAGAEVVRLPGRARPERPARELDTAA